MSSKKRLLVLVVLLCLAVCLAFLPCLPTVRDGEGWQASAYNLKQIGLALRTYHEMYGRWPPAMKLGADGQPLYSWRVLLLPFLEEQYLFGQFKLDEPWDGPHNKPLLEKIPKCYMLATASKDAAGMTPYQVFVGPGTAFEQDDFPDVPSDMMLVVEAASAVPWTKPADLVYAPGQPLPPLGGHFRKPIHLWCYELGRRDGFNACFADGQVRFLYSDTDERTLRGYISRNGEKPE